MTKTPITLFISYSHHDDNLRIELEKHLSLLKRQNLIKTWYSRKILPGEQWQGAISKNLYESNIILLLVSADFLASDYCYDIEVKTAMELHQKGCVTVVPIMLRPVDLSGAPFEGLQGLPLNLLPVISWENKDDAFYDITIGIRSLIEKINTV